MEPMNPDVRRALKVMRRANTQESKVERQLKKLEEYAQQLAHSGKKLPNRPAAQHEQQHHNPENDILFDNGPPIVLRTFDELQSKAKHNHVIAGEMSRMESRGQHLGQPRKIFVSLIHDIKAEQAEIQQKQAEQKQLELRKRKEVKKREQIIANTIDILRKKRADNVGDSGDATSPSGIHERTTMLAKLAANRRVITSTTGVTGNNDSSIQAEIISVSLRPNSPPLESPKRLGSPVDDSCIRGDQARPSLVNSVGRVRPNTAGAARSSTIKSTGVLEREEGAFAKYVKSLPEFHDSNTMSGSLAEPSQQSISPYAGIMGMNANSTISGRRPTKMRPTTAVPVGQRARASAWGAGAVIDKDNKLAKVLELRKKIAEEKENEIRMRAVEREERHDKTRALKERRIRQKAILVMIKLYFFLARLRNNKRLTDLCGMRTRRMLIAKLASRTFAGIKLSRWWKRMKIRKLLLAHPKALFTLGYCVRYIWARLQLRRRKQGAKLLTKFLKDAYDKAFLMKAIYGFRKSCIRMQRWFRGYFRIQQARLQLLYLAMEKIERQREEAAKEEHFRSLRLSVKAMAKMEGFASTVEQINVVQRRLHRLLDEEDKAMKKLFREQSISDDHDEGDDYADIREKDNREVIEQVQSHRSVGHKTGKDTKESKETKDTPHEPTPSWKPVSRTGFIKKMMATPLGAYRLELLREVLRQQRMRHSLYIDESQLRNKKVDATIKVNRQGLRTFLKNPNNNIEGIDQVFNGINERDALKSNKVEHANACMFLLLTKGGWEALKCISSVTYNDVPEEPYVPPHRRGFRPHSTHLRGSHGHHQSHHGHHGHHGHQHHNGHQHLHGHQHPPGHHYGHGTHHGGGHHGDHNGLHPHTDNMHRLPHTHPAFAHHVIAHPELHPHLSQQHQHQHHQGNKHGPHSPASGHSLHGAPSTASSNSGHRSMSMSMGSMT